MNTNTSLNISLPKTLKTYVTRRVSQKHFSNPSDYIRTLIREDRVHQEEEKLEQMLVEGIESGPAELMTQKDWNALWGRARKEAKRRRRTV